jgi:hypothetical protein
MYPWTVRGQGCSATENVEYVSAACRARTERDCSELRWTVERARESMKRMQADSTRRRVRHGVLQAPTASDT